MIRHAFFEARVSRTCVVKRFLFFYFTDDSFLSLAYQFPGYELQSNNDFKTKFFFEGRGGVGLFVGTIKWK